LLDLDEIIELITKGATGLQPTMGSRPGMDLERDLNPDRQNLRAFENPLEEPIVDLFDGPDDSPDLLAGGPAWLREVKPPADGVDLRHPTPNRPAPAGFKGWMEKYENGRIPANALAPVRGGSFRSDAAAGWKQMVRAARKQGVNISLTDSYRDYPSQVAVYGAKPGLAAKPGTSVHGWGLAADVGEGREWIQKNGERFGWVWPDWARPGGSKPEPWHFEFEGSPAAANAPTPRNRRPKNKPRGPQPGKLPRNLVNPTSPLVVLPMAFDATLNEAFEEPIREKARSTPRPGKMGKGVKAQLRAGFRSVGRNDLARFVDHPDFQTWIQQESGWNPKVVSPANNKGLANGGLFQFWFGHDWAAPYNKNGNFTMTVFDQAVNAVKHFGLTVGEIKRYATSIRNGSYGGWG
jgi:hypothetical protein